MNLWVKRTGIIILILIFNLNLRLPLKSEIILTAMQELSLPYQTTDAKLSQLTNGASEFNSWIV